MVSLPPGKIPGTHQTGECVGTEASWMFWRKEESYARRDSNPVRPARSLVTILTML